MRNRFICNGKKLTILNQIDDSIYHKGFYISDAFLNDAHYKELRNILQKAYSNGNFKLAKIGLTSHANHQLTIRNDQIFWLDETMTNSGVQAYFNKMSGIQTKLNQTLFLGLNTIEAHFAVYKPGRFYKKHVDQFKENLDRRISCVYYLNENWQPEHGGELKLYDKEDNLLVNVEPRGNRFICFNSDLPHEVSVAHHIRYSIAGWLKVRALY